MWQHVGVYNLKPCTNPLHRGGHRVPSTGAPSEDLYLARYAARYLGDTFEAFDDFRGLTPVCESALERLEDEMEELGREIAAAEERESRGSSDASPVSQKEKKPGGKET
jgi:hypothetical protein